MLIPLAMLVLGQEALANPDLRMTGTCPGPATLHATGLTPGGSVRLTLSSYPYSQQWSTGSCPDALVQSSSGDFQRTLTADATGAIHRSVTLSPAQCGQWAEVLDEGSCLATGAWPVDGWGAAVATMPPTLRDHDLAEDGSYTQAWAIAGRVVVSCTSASGQTRYRMAGAAADTGFGSSIATFTSRTGDRTLVAWRNYHGDGEDLRYAMFDAACTPLVTNQTIATSEYFEFFDAQISDDGRAVVAWSDGDTEAAFISPTGALLQVIDVMNIGAYYGTHVAMNPSTGAGIVAAQVHSGDGIYYRRFDHLGNWMDAAPVQVPAGYHYWYDGFTVGMNDLGQFVFEWRDDGDSLKLRFYDATGILLSQVSRTTIDFEGWGGGHCYDSFRLRHQEIPLDGQNFVLGEVYNWIIGAGQTVQHFTYSPTGTLLATGSTSFSVPEGLTIRTDGQGNAVVRDGSGLHWLPNYP